MRERVLQYDAMVIDESNKTNMTQNSDYKWNWKRFERIQNINKQVAWKI